MYKAMYTCIYKPPFLRTPFSSPYEGFAGQRGRTVESRSAVLVLIRTTPAEQPVDGHTALGRKEPRAWRLLRRRKTTRKRSMCMCAIWQCIGSVWQVRSVCVSSAASNPNECGPPISWHSTASNPNEWSVPRLKATSYGRCQSHK